MPYLSPQLNTSNRGTAWLITSLLVAGALFYVAISKSVYELTSPSFLSWHVLLRKAYSVGAFTVVGVLFAKGPRQKRRLTVTIGAVALYSAAIEVAQYLTGAREGLVSNAVDVFCGALGGGLGAFAYDRLPTQLKR